VSEHRRAVARLAAAAVPVVYDLLTDAELERVCVVHRLGEDAPDGPEAVLVVTARGEESQHSLWRLGQAEESAAAVRARIASELQDFVSGSRFGWGQQRRWPPADR
jgi:hypothetical protein